MRSGEVLSSGANRGGRSGGSGFRIEIKGDGEESLIDGEEGKKKHHQEEKSRY